MLLLLGIYLTPINHAMHFFGAAGLSAAQLPHSVVVVDLRPSPDICWGRVVMVVQSIEHTCMQRDDDDLLNTGHSFTSQSLTVCRQLLIYLSILSDDFSTSPSTQDVRERERERGSKIDSYYW